MSKSKPKFSPKTLCEIAGHLDELEILYKAYNLLAKSVQESTIYSLIADYVIEPGRDIDDLFKDYKGCYNMQYGKENEENE